MIFLLAIPVTLAGFILASSMAATLSENTWWLLGAGISVSFLAPFVLSSWLRALRRPRRAAGTDSAKDQARPRVMPKYPTTSSTVLVLNLAMLIGAATLAPIRTRSQVDTHGAWWIREIASHLERQDGDPLITRGEAAVSWLTSLIPASSDEGLAKPIDLPMRSDGGAELSSDLQVPRSDGGTEPPDKEVQVSFEREGSAVVVPVRLSGPAGEVTVKMIFDTGATLTTLNSATLNRLGLVVDSSAPTVESHTANGTVRRQLTLIQGASLGGARVSRPLTVGLCDLCAKDKVVGLLGLNFSRNFLMTMDHDDGRIVLKPKVPPPDHTFDVQHFVKLDNARGIWRGRTLTVDLVVRNLAPLALRDVQITATVEGPGGTGMVRGILAKVPARGSTPLHMSGKLPSRGKSFKLKLEKALW